VFTASNGVRPSATQYFTLVVTVPKRVPRITRVTPNSGSQSGFTLVRITGANLAPKSGGALIVRFGETRAYVVSDSSCAIVVFSPPGRGPVDITVSIDGVTSTVGPADRFTYVDFVSGRSGQGWI